MRRVKRIVVFLLLCAFNSSHASGGIIIQLQELAGTTPTLTGGGTLTSIMQQAAGVWELAFHGAGDVHTLHLSYTWQPIGLPTLAEHSLGAQGGSPNRETMGQIRFNSAGVNWFADGSLSSADPLHAGNEEFSTYTESANNFGGGLLNDGRVFSGATGNAAGRYDLFTVALHEIGHALGMSAANLSYRAETALDNDIDVAGPLPYAGSTIPTNNSGPVPPGSFNAHLTAPNTLLYPFISAGVRKLPTAADILANAQLSRFTDPNLALESASSSVPEPSSVLFMATVGAAAFVGRRRAA